MVKKVAKKRSAKELKESKKSLRIALLISFVIIVILAAVVVLPKYLMNLDGTEKLEYNGYKFEKRSIENTRVDAYFTKFYDQEGRVNEVPFHYPPNVLESLLVDSGVRSDLLKYDRSSLVYISIDPNMNGSYVLSGTELAKILGQKLLGFRVKSALSAPIDGKFDTDIVSIPINGSNETNQIEHNLRTSQGIDVRNCEDARSNVFVIQIKEMQRNYIGYSDNCATISATTPENALMLTDALIYRLLGIMED